MNAFQHRRTDLHSLLHCTREVRVRNLEINDCVLLYLHPISGAYGHHGPLWTRKADSTVLFVESDSEGLTKQGLR